MKKQYRPGKQIYRIPPCPSYDIAGMESWLTELAAEGLFLTADGFFAGLGFFEYREPKRVKYRLEAAQKGTSMWADNNGDPEPEQIELGEKYSWEYVAKRKDFYIYRSEDPSARELNTDPAVQALALNAVKKRQRGAAFCTVFFLLIYPILLTRGCLLLTTIATGTVWTALVLLFAALMIADEVRAFIHLKKVQRALTEEGGYPAEQKKKSPAAYFAGKAVRIVLVLVLLCAFLRSWGLDIMDENKIPLDDYTGTIPFATIRDFAGEGSSEYTQTMTGMAMGFNTLEEKHDLLAPRCIDYNEEARLRCADGSVLDAGLYVDYYELRSPALAKMLCREVYRLDRLKKNFEPLDTPELPADCAAAFLDSIHFPTILIRRGNIVVRAYFYQYQASGKKLSLAEWTGMLCDSLER